MILIHNNPTSASNAYSFLHMSSQPEQSRLEPRGSTVAERDSDLSIPSGDSDISLRPLSQPLPDDVVRCVLDFLNVEGSPGDRMTCARCARVSQAWQEPALRVLWHTLRLKPKSICPLYRIVWSVASTRMWRSFFRYDTGWAEYFNHVSASVMLSGHVTKSDLRL